MAQAPHRWLAASLALILGFPLMATAAPGGKPIAPHPENPRYFLFGGKPTFLITSGEHYGAVLNLDFDFVPYLDELHAPRVQPDADVLGDVSRGPRLVQDRGTTRWPRRPGGMPPPGPGRRRRGRPTAGTSSTSTRWDEAYFRRLKTFCAAAGERGIVVEFVLFCPFYEEALWAVNPMNAPEQRQRRRGDAADRGLHAQAPRVVARHEAFVRKVVAELKEFDNLYYEICNEPYFGGVTLDWQARIARTIAEAETRPARPAHDRPEHRQRHGQDRRPDPEVSLFNFHYASPPDG